MKIVTRDEIVKAIRLHFDEEVQSAYDRLRSATSVAEKSDPLHGGEQLRFTSEPDEGGLDLEKLVYK
jgi:hypothetical protein